MSCEQRISLHSAISSHAAPNHGFRKLPDLLILHEIISRRINTYRIPKRSRISFIRVTFKSARINTSGAKDLKSIRINTSGNKDLKSFRINTSKKPGRGRVPPAFSGISSLATRHCSLAARFFPQLATRHSSLAALHIYFHAHRFTIRATLRGAI